MPDDAKLIRLKDAFYNAYGLVTHKPLDDASKRRIEELVSNRSNIPLAERDVENLRSILPAIDSPALNVYSLSFDAKKTNALKERLLKTEIFRLIKAYNKTCPRTERINYDIETVNALQIVRSVFQWHEAVGQGDNSYLKLPSPALKLSGRYGVEPRVHGYYNELQPTLVRGGAIDNLGVNFRPWSPVFIFVGGSFSDYRLLNLTDPYAPQEPKVGKDGKQTTEDVPVGNDRRQAANIEVVTPGWLGLSQNVLYWLAGLVKNNHFGLSDPTPAERGTTTVKYQNFHMHDTRAISTVVDPAIRTTGWDLSVLQSYSQNAVVGLCGGSQWGYNDGLKFGRRYLGWEAFRTDEYTNGWTWTLRGKMTDGWYSSNTMSGTAVQTTEEASSSWVPPLFSNEKEMNDEGTGKLRLRNFQLYGMYKIEKAEPHFLGIKLPYLSGTVSAERKKEFRLQSRSEYKAEVGVGWFTFGYGEILNYGPQIYDPNVTLDDHRSYERSVGLHIPIGRELKIDANYYRISNANYDSHSFIDGRRSRGSVEGATVALTLSWGGKSQKEVKYLVAPSQCYLPGEASSVNRDIIYDYFKKMYQEAQAFGGTEALDNDASLSRGAVVAASSPAPVVAAPAAPAPAPTAAAPAPAAAPVIVAIDSNPIEIDLSEPGKAKIKAMFASGGSGTAGLTQAGIRDLENAKELVKFLYSKGLCSLTLAIDGSASAGGTAAQNRTLSVRRAADGEAFIRDTLQGTIDVATLRITTNPLGDTQSIIDERAYMTGWATTHSSATPTETASARRSFRDTCRYFKLVLTLDVSRWPTYKRDAAVTARLDSFQPGLTAKFEQTYNASLAPAAAAPVPAAPVPPLRNQAAVDSIYNAIQRLRCSVKIGTATFGLMSIPETIDAALQPILTNANRSTQLVTWLNGLTALTSDNTVYPRNNNIVVIRPAPTPAAPVPAPAAPAPASAAPVPVAPAAAPSGTVTTAAAPAPTLTYQALDEGAIAVCQRLQCRIKIGTATFDRSSTLAAIDTALRSVLANDTQAMRLDDWLSTVPALTGANTVFPQNNRIVLVR